ncbi:MAG: SET domain-containing protein [Planctomycetes bacterium]|nr:SET domain-containing protein [Planctomycetota bacterium]
MDGEAQALGCDQGSRIGVAVRGTHRYAVALRAIGVAECIVEVAGELRDQPSQTSLQIDERVHLDVPEHLDPEVVARRFPWRFLDHSCRPNAAFRGRRLIALEDIAPGRAVTFHYATTEYDLAVPFACECGEEDCLGVIRGYRALSGPQRERLSGAVLPHVLRCAGREVGS